ncbi:GNS1/SUR4 membrane protein [Basidiobolus meristosporus CBS 931.73]|uniref:Elongation of fatty acids protein n=1 Tax=Basidiobolus meristosporus CBS 931.73 TaxID=1314790 RepID=A0A1Y1XPS6_9FUNG|nr:GNS1/SUR4 membrane protein [Basidiobolus meristosporus CBS 931.73]|eukprot:ORX87731.1 GNS1/SUR4 membrane protein [Basidiobolus meristosporus CBS 931.73]
MWNPERPFGISFEPLFEKLYKAVTGQTASEFRFIEGVTPLSTPTEVFVSCILYLAIIFGGQYLLKNRKPFKLDFLFKVHNIFLTLVSLGLLVLILENIIPIYARGGLLYAICDRNAWTQRLELLYYLNYLVKYYELIDTLFLVLKKKKLEFLHYYHHSLTMVLCYSQLMGNTSVSWVPITLNLIVHVLMYYYYYRATSGARIWWKKYLTTLQITQFVLDLGFVYFCTYTYFAFNHFPYMPNMGTCSGTIGAALFGCALLSSYLVLFISFFRKTYKKPAAKAKKN